MLFILTTLIRWRKFVLSAGFATALVAGGVSFLLPKWYTATASVFPPETQSPLPGYLDVMQSLQLPIFGPNAVGVRPETIYIDILLSRKVGEQVIDEFGYKEIYGAQHTMEAIKTLHSHATMSLLENGLLMITFEDRDPERAAAVTNRLIQLLDEFNQQMNNTKASRTKEFIAEQMKVRESSLAAAEDTLRGFQEQHKTLILDEQLGAAIEMVADLTAQAVALEVELEILRDYTSTGSEEYVRKSKQYQEILGQLKKFKIGSARSEDDFVRSFFPAFEEIPEVGLDLARLTRRVKIEEKIYGMLIQEFEKARIEEARDTPTVSVLDVAKVPERRTRPKRKVVIIVGGLLGLAWSAIFVVFVTVWREDERRSSEWKNILQPIATDFRRFSRKKS